MKRKCFVIQPFDGGKYDKRYESIFKPAIEAAELDPYRVDKKYAPGVEIAIDAIGEGIKSCAICLADVTENNPNVCYELGFALALDKPVVMVCSSERTGKYPFDIQHRILIPYDVGSPQDFKALEGKITEKIIALLKKEAGIQKIAFAEPLPLVDGISNSEHVFLACLANGLSVPHGFSTIWSVSNDVEKAGQNQTAFNLAVRKLRAKKFIKISVRTDEEHPYEVVEMTDIGWAWIEANVEKFVLQRAPARSQKLAEFDDEIPF